MPSGWKELPSPASYSHHCRAVLWDFEDLQRDGEQSALINPHSDIYSMYTSPIANASVLHPATRPS